MHLSEPEALALVLASTKFDENDYIRNYTEFKAFTAQQPNRNNQIQQTNDYIRKEGTTNTVDQCGVLDLAKNHRIKGNITVIENRDIIPFDIQRVYYLYDIPGGEERGAHAHKDCHQLLIAASGAFDIMLDDGKSKRTVTLNRPYMGLHIPPGVWAAEMGFSSGAICLVLASHKYDAEDYIREYQDYLKWKLLK